MSTPPRRLWTTLDKDLTHLTESERAAQVAHRPVLRLWLGIMIAVAAGWLAQALLGGPAGTVTVATGVVLAVWLGLSLGANDVANSMGPAVGGGALGAPAALVLAAAAEVAGASLAGGQVIDTLAGTIIVREHLLLGGDAGRVMAAALIAAAGWITLATWVRAPVSTTHSIVGGIAGAGIIAFGPAAVDWPGMAMITAGWIVSPLLSGLIAAGLLAFVHRKIDRTPDRAGAARLWIPVLMGLMAGLFAAYLGGVLGASGRTLLAVAAVMAVAGWAAACRLVTRHLLRGGREKVMLRRVFGVPLAAAAVLVSFAHGANDVANVAAPLAVIVQGAGVWGAAINPPAWVPLMAGLTVALGILLYGRRLIEMVGKDITRLSPVRAFCIACATAATVLMSSSAGFPVSTTHVAVGGLFGVGFYREWDDSRRRRAARAPLPPEERQRRRLIRRSHVQSITAAWVVTVPVVALLAALTYSLMGLAV